MLDKLVEILKDAAPALATIAAGPAGGLLVKTISEKLGVASSVEAVVETLQQNPEQALRLREIDVRQFEVAESNVTARWQADMGSDSWLAKNVRPATLVYLLSAYLLLAILDGFGFRVSESYVQLLGQWGMLVMTAYFGGRTVEKVFGLLKGK